MVKTRAQTPPVSPLHARLATMFVTVFTTLRPSNFPVLISDRSNDDVKIWTGEAMMYYFKNYNFFRCFTEDADMMVEHINRERSGRAAA